MYWTSVLNMLILFSPLRCRQVVGPCSTSLNTSHVGEDLGAIPLPLITGPPHEAESDYFDEAIVHIEGDNLQINFLDLG